MVATLNGMDGVTMDDSELASILWRKIRSALNDEGDEVSANRERNMAYYRGDLYGNEREGQSKIVTRECMEAVEWAMPSVIRALTSAGSVTFDAVGPEDEAAADQETDVVRHHLFEKNNGFLAIHNWAKDSLMYPNGYAKIWIDESQETSTCQYHGLTPGQVQMVMSYDGAEVIAQESRQDLIMGQPVEVFDIEVKTTTTKRRLCFEAVPPEEVLVDADLTTVDLDQADFVAHKVRRSYTWLVNAGFDRDLLKETGTDGDEGGTEKETRRMFDEGDSDDEEALREYTVYECFALVDFDGDGIAERRQVTLIGNTIFENEESDYCPLVAMSSILMPHQHTGMSLIDLVADLQLAGSALLRQLLTNIYRVNVPRKYVGENALVDGGMTLDALLNLESEIIPVRDPSAIVPEPIQPMAQHILPVMQQMGEIKQLRTGINPQLALDPAILKQTTQGQFTQALDAASQRLEMIVRVMAETGIKKAFQKAHRMIREHMGQESAVKLTNAWVDVNPSEWKERTDLRVKVGVGNQQKEHKAATLQNVLGMQMQLLQMGIPFVKPQNIFNTLTEMVQAFGFKDATKFFTDPQTIPPPQPPPPDPMQEAAKAQAQAMMIDAQSKMAKVEAEKQKMGLEAQLAQAKLQLDMMKAQQQAQSDQQGQMLEYQVRQAELQAKQIDAGLKEAQRIKTMEDAQKVHVETALLIQKPVTEVINGPAPEARI